VNEARSGESMNECRELEAMLAAYVDGETQACDCERVRRHTESCACCRDRVQAQRAARETVRARRSGLRACASPSLKARCASYAATGASAPSRASTKIPAASLRRWVPLSLAATLVLAVTSFFGFGLNDKVQALTFQTTIDHAKCTRFTAGPPPEDPIDAARRFQASYGFPITVPASSAPEHLQLRAIRRCAVMDGRVAHLIYTWMGEPLSVYVLPKPTLSEATEFGRQFKYNSVIWVDHGRTYIVVTEHQRGPELEKLTAYVRASAF
jgi:anti-sigma factor RsiW